MACHIDLLDKKIGMQERKEINILIVDDMEENLIALEAMLDAPNRTFIRATSGNEALKVALKKENIGLVILDIQMPLMDGFEVASILQSNPRTRDISIIFVTAINKEQHYVLRGFEGGAVDYLSKPLDISLTKAKVAVFERLYFYQQSLKQALNENKEVNDKLERFMYVVAHDLKAPLSAVRSLIAIIQDELTAMEIRQVHEYLALCEQSTDNLQQMISSILNYSRTNEYSLTKEKVMVADLLNELRESLLLPKHITYVIKPNLPVLYTVKTKLYHVFQNLVTNAIKHNEKPNVVVELGMAEEDDHFYTFYVKDNGKGLAKDNQKKIFNLFETIDSEQGNTGIGLNLAKMFVEKQGGVITLDSELGVGSTFYFQWRKNET